MTGNCAEQEKVTTPLHSEKYHNNYGIITIALQKLLCSEQKAVMIRVIFFFLRHFHSLPFPTWRGWFLIVGYMDDMEHQVFTPPGQSSHLPLTNWPAPNVWVFIAQMVEHCSPNAEAMSSNPVEVLNLFVCLFVFFGGEGVFAIA